MTTGMKMLKTGTGRSEEALKAHGTRTKRFSFLRDRLAAVDVEDLWNRLEAELTIGAGRKDPEKLGRALDEVDGNLRRSMMLYQITIDEQEEFGIDYRAVFAEWEVAAKKSLSADKTLKGQLTQDGIKNWVAAHVPKFREWEKTRLDLQRSKNLAEGMKKAWESRAASIRKLADIIQPRRGSETTMLPRRTRGDEGENQDGNVE